MQTLYDVPVGLNEVFDVTVHAPPPLACNVPLTVIEQLIVVGTNRPDPGIVESVDGASVKVTFPDVTGFPDRSLMTPV